MANFTFASIINYSMRPCDEIRVKINGEWCTTKKYYSYVSDNNCFLLRRSTAFGIHSGLGRLGAILGNVMFGHLIDVNRGIPVLIVASLLTVGAGCAMLLPPIYRAENRPPLERYLNQWGTKCKKRTIADND